MRFVGTILALLIAVSVALLPVASAAVAGRSHAAVTAAASPSPDCCGRDAAPCDQAHKSMGECATMAACAECFNFTAAAVPGVYRSWRVAGVDPVPVRPRVDLQLGFPPFRPPRV